MRSLVDSFRGRTAWRWVAGISAFGVVAAASVGVASAATTSPSVKFSKIQYNSPGTDDRSSSSLYAEFVRLTNMTGKAVSLKGWTVKDAAGHKYTFGTYTLPAYANAYVHTGKGTDGKPDSQHRYWQSGNYIWNNDGDTATLRNASGSTVHSCKWSSGSASVTYCGTKMPTPPKTLPATTTRPATPPTTRPAPAPTTATPTDAQTEEPPGPPSTLTPPIYNPTSPLPSPSDAGSGGVTSPPMTPPGEDIPADPATDLPIPSAPSSAGPPTILPVPTDGEIVSSS